MHICKTKKNLGYKKKIENTERHGKHNSRQENEKEREVKKRKARRGLAIDYL